MRLLAVITLTRCSAVLGVLLALFSSAAPAQSERAQAYQEFRENFDARRYDVALPAAQKVVALTEQQYGATHPALVAGLTNLGTTQYRLRDYGGAEDSYVRAIRIAEGSEGAFGRSLIAPLLGLGVTYQATNRQAEAVPTLQRAVDVSRKLDGLFATQQLELLPPLITSYVAMNRVDDAEREQKRALQLSEQLYGAADIRMLPALDRMARWYELTGRFRGAMQTQQRAMAIVTKVSNESDIRLVEPLRGVARAYRLEFVHGPELRDELAHAPPPLILIGDNYNPPRLSGMIQVPPEEGERALRLALEIIDGNPEQGTHAMRGETLIDLGDYYLVDRAFRSAAPFYQQAWTELTAPGGPGTALLSQPVRLFYRTSGREVTPTSNDAASYVQRFTEVEYTVSAEGKVEDIRMIENGGSPESAKAFISSLRQARYRPRFENGAPVATPAMRQRQLVYVRKSGD